MADNTRTRDIRITVALDAHNIPDTIRWQANDAPTPEPQNAEAFLLGFWDAEDRATLRIDLWTKRMQVPHMNAMFFQTLLSMADTYQRATGNEAMAEEMRDFARSFADRVPLPVAEGDAGEQTDQPSDA